MWEPITDVISLIIPFIVWSIISIGIDEAMKFLENLMHIIPRLPDKFEPWIAYIITVCIAFLFCKEANWDLFSYMDTSWNHEWEGWLASAMIVSGGSRFVRKTYKIIEQIPYSISGAKSPIKNIFSKTEYKNNTLQSHDYVNDIVDREENYYTNNI